MKKSLSSMLAATVAGLLLSSGVALAQGTAQRTAEPARTTSQTAAQQQAGQQRAPAAEKLDINSASTEALEGLEGIGPARAAAIVKGRPYKGKDDLVRRKIVPQSVYDKIGDRIIARQK
jgi:DNA uptake protein ComE-like DNA-binding protein